LRRSAVSERRLILGDCLDVLPTLAAESFDAVVTDPPYGQTNEGYDRGVDHAVWRECFRVCKPDAALVSFAGSPTYHRIASGIEAAGWRVRQMWGWVYRDGMITSAYPREGFDRLAPAMDPLVFATKGKVLLRLEREGRPWKINKPRSKVSPLSGRSRFPETTGASGRYPKAVVSDGVEPFEYFVGARTHSRRGDRTDHPNQKPLGLMRWIISKLPPGGRILDPYAGSGTTLVAAAAEGFGAVGVEIDATYFAIAEKRLAAAPAETPSFTAADGGGLP
jgi:site-specific DNA-methyltransferase (adenine-specific)